MYIRLTIIIVILYCLTSLLYGYRGIFNYTTNVSRPKRLVVSMSSLPSRIQNIREVIHSINQNTYVPDIIYINIPVYSKREKSHYQIPDDIKNINNVRIHICKEDYGPVTKLYPTLSEEPDPETVIICVDDDKIYSNKLIESLLAGSDVYKNNCVCISGWNYINFGIIALPFINIGCSNTIRKVSILQCYNGVLYKRKFFDDNLERYINMKSCFTTDDIMISKYLINKRIDIISINFNIRNKDIEQDKKLSLGSSNLLNNTWIKCINSS